jgi:hypothetical protein
LACFGLGGTEFASADEVANAIHQQTTQRANQPVKKPNAVEPPKQSITPTAGALDGFTAQEKELLHGLAEEVTFFVKNNDVAQALEVAGSLSNDEKTALWSLLPSNVRSAMKKG